MNFSVGGTEVIDSGKNFSISRIQGENRDYRIGVKLDTNIFDGVSPRNWTSVVRDFVYNNLAGKSVQTFDADGNPEIIQFAKKNERVKKDGTNNTRKVLDKLATVPGNVQKLSVVHLDELLKVPYGAQNTQEHSHQWLDENGWEIRTVYLQDKFGMIYEANLNIAKARDGRKILYSVSNVKNIDAGNAQYRSISGTGAPQSSMFNNNISQNQEFSNRKIKISHRDVLVIKNIA